MNELHDLMERSTDELLPDVAGLVRGGMERGRTRRRRRRAGLAAGALTGAAALASVALVAPTLIGTGKPDTPLVPAVIRPAASPTGSSSLLPSPEDLAAGRVITLPGGTSTLIKSWGSREQGFLAASWKFAPADGSPAGLVEARLDIVDTSRVPAGSSVSVDQACRSKDAPCHRDADGSWTITATLTRRNGPGDVSLILGANGSRWAPSGLHLSVTAYNAMGEKDVPTTRPDPVLTRDQLLAMVRAADLGRSASQSPAG
jgi:hypothetical protein